MSICYKCINLNFYIEITADGERKATHAKYIDECAFYPDMVCKINHKNECPHFEDKLDDNSIQEEEDA